MYKIVKYSL